MKQVTIKNFRLFKISKDKELYDTIETKNLIISIYDHQKLEEHLFFGTGEYFSQKSVFDLTFSDVQIISSNLNTDNELILGLLNTANEEDEDPMFSYFQKNGGEIQVIDLFSQPTKRDEGALKNYHNEIAILVSTGNMEIEEINVKGLRFDNSLVNYDELIGCYDEENEFVFVYKRK